MSLIKKFEVGSGGTVSLFKRGDEYFVYKRPHKTFEHAQPVEYEVQLALWKRYNEGFVKHLFSEMRDERLCFAMEWFESKHFEMENVEVSSQNSQHGGSFSNRRKFKAYFTPKDKQ